MTTNINTVKTAGTETLVVKDKAFTIPLRPEYHKLIMDASDRLDVPAAEFGRALLLVEAARIMGVEAPVLVKAKRGPKGGPRHPLAVQHNLTTAEFNRRLAFHVKNGVSNIKKIDFSVDPFAKAEEAEMEAPVVETSSFDSIEAV